jgi:hypothetical protein
LADGVEGIRILAGLSLEKNSSNPICLLIPHPSIREVPPPAAPSLTQVR